MESIINKLFNGGVPETEKLLDPTLYKRNKQLDDAENKFSMLLASLNKEQTALFEAWRDIEDSIWVSEVDRAYARGFKTGALLMIEVHDLKI